MRALPKGELRWYRYGTTARHLAAGQTLGSVLRTAPVSSSSRSSSLHGNRAGPVYRAGRPGLPPRGAPRAAVPAPGMTTVEA
jgi:hypothetical protein